VGDWRQKLVVEQGSKKGGLPRHTRRRPKGKWIGGPEAHLLFHNSEKKKRRENNTRSKTEGNPSQLSGSEIVRRGTKHKSSEENVAREGY